MTALRTTIASISLTLLIANSGLAGPPLATDDTGTVDIGRVEVELNGAYTYDKETAFGVTTKCSRADAEMKITTGLARNLGISLAIPYNINDRVKEDNQPSEEANGFGDMTVEVKYAFAEMSGTSFAIKPSVIMPTGEYNDGLSEGRWQFGATLIATSEFEEGKYALHANLGYEHHNYRNDAARDSNRNNLWSGSIAGEAEVAKGLFAVAEAGLATTADKTTDELSACALVGARYEINDFMDINAGIKLGLTKPEDDVSILYGLVLKF
jgi:hypothetical protein